MKTRKIGTMEVSPVGMGCMGFSHGYGKVPDEGYAIEAIRAAHEFGCTFFDTAESYGKQQFWPGHNEQLVGKALEPIRDEVVLATKLHFTDEEATGAEPLAQVVRRHLARSLENLRTDHVELYYLHRVHNMVPVEEVAAVMGELIEDGLIGGWGMSQVEADTIAAAHAVTPVSAVQNLYNMLERDCEERVFPFCLEHGIAVVPFSPVASGFLSGKVTSQSKFEGDDVRRWVKQLQPENIDANRPVIDLISSYAEAKGATNAQVAIAWMLAKYPNVVPIPGSKNRERILENLGSWDVELSADEFAELDAALDGIEVHGHRGIVESEGNSFADTWTEGK